MPALYNQNYSRIKFSQKYGDCENFQFVHAVRYLESHLQQLEATTKSCESKCRVRGYHVYHRIWDAAVGKELNCDESQASCIAIPHVHVTGHTRVPSTYSTCMAW